MEDTLNYFGGDELAATVWLSKYAIKLPDGTKEKTPDEMHLRMAKEFARVNTKYHTDTIELEKLSEYGKYRVNKPLTEEVIFELFRDFKQIVPQGSIMATLGNPNVVASLSNCFVIGHPADSYGGILQKDQEMVQLMKRRGGVGIDISTLRPATAEVTNAAKTSTGAVSFMHRYSSSTNEVAQEGRRGALMLSIDVRHPDVTEFVKIKKDRTSVTGANISIMNRDEFMKAVEEDEDYILRFPCNIDLSGINHHFDELEYNVIKEYPFESDTRGTAYIKKIKAKELYDELVEANWLSAEPGNIYIDRHWNYSPDGVYPQYKGVTTNPCGEIFMGEYDACRLMALNLMAIVKNPFEEDSQINFELLYALAYNMQVLADDLVDLELEHIDRVIEKILSDPESMEIKRAELELWEKVKKVAASGRRTGCGFTALGDMLAAIGMKYDSPVAMNVVNDVMKIKMQAELDASIDMAIIRGPFEGWSKHKEFEFYSDKGGKDILSEGNSKGMNDWYEMLLKEFPQQALRMYKYARRNVSFSTVAPTGTVSIMTQTTGGIEPLFAPYFIRRKKINPSDKGNRVDFVDELGVEWQEFPVLHPQFKYWIENTRAFEAINERVKKGDNTAFVDVATRQPLPTIHQVVETAEELPKAIIEEFFKNSPWFGSVANDIDWLKRVELQAIVQKYTTHSISSTINLPEDVSKEKISEIYMTAWKMGLKGVTVYRDGSRSGVLINESKTDTSKKDFEYYDVIDRPEELDAHLHVVTTRGTKFAVVVGMLDDKPYEMFAFANTSFEEGCSGKVIKKSKGIYSFKSPHSDIEDLQLTDHHDEALLMRMVSMLLRYGAKPQYVVEQIDKVDLNIQAFGQSVKRVLKQYISEGSVSSDACPECGTEGSLVYEEGCRKCRSCGSSKC